MCIKHFPLQVVFTSSFLQHGQICVWGRSQVRFFFSRFTAAVSSLYLTLGMVTSVRALLASHHQHVTVTAGLNLTEETCWMFWTLLRPRARLWSLPAATRGWYHYRVQPVYNSIDLMCWVFFHSKHAYMSLEFPFTVNMIVMFLVLPVVSPSCSPSAHLPDAYYLNPGLRAFWNYWKAAGEKQWVCVYLCVVPGLHTAAFIMLRSFIRAAVSTSSGANFPFLSRLVIDLDIVLKLNAYRIVHVCAHVYVVVCSPWPLILKGLPYLFPQVLAACHRHLHHQELLCVCFSRSF